MKIRKKNLLHGYNFPIEWGTFKISEICHKIYSGGTPLRSRDYFYNNGNINWIKSGEIRNSKIENTEEFINELGLKKSAAKLFPSETVLFALYGQGPTAGRVAYIEKSMASNQACLGLVCKKKILFYKYLFYFFQLIYTRIRAQRYSGAQPNFNAQYVKTIKISLPDKSEQQKIVFILENIDKLIQITQRLIEKLQEGKKGLMQRLFTEGIGHTEFKSHKQKKIPSSWEILDFEESVKKNSQKLGSVKKSEFKNEGLYPIIDQGQEFIAGYSDKDDLIYDGELPIIIFGDHTRIFKFIDFRFICGADGTKVLKPNTEHFDPLFLYYYFSHLRIKNLGYSRHFKLLKESQILKPSINEQRKISKILENIDRTIQNELEYKKKMIKIKKGLMQTLLTGKKRVPL